MSLAVRAYSGFRATGLTGFLMSRILLTGGAGFIGSHICLKLLQTGHDLVVFDNLSNGHRDALPADTPFIEGDIRDSAALGKLLKSHDFSAVIHLAGLIEAGISVQDPASFYDVNVAGSVRLFEAMRATGVRRLVFSSSAAVYGAASASLLTEDEPVLPVNPYGRSKAMIEDILRDYAAVYGFSAIALRYFNAAGADPKGRAGERHDPETHLIPLGLMAATGQHSGMKIFGTDYDTKDGTCTRDYVHVDDVARAHVPALEYLFNQAGGVFEAVNIGTGRGYSVREVLECCRAVSGKSFPIDEAGPRAGDSPRLVASADKARKILNWQPEYPDLRDMVSHAWNFMQSSSDE